MLQHIFMDKEVLLQRSGLIEQEFDYSISQEFQKIVISGGIPGETVEYKIISADAWGHENMLLDTFSVNNQFDENGNIYLSLQCSNTDHADAIDKFAVVWGGGGCICCSLAR